MTHPSKVEQRIRWKELVGWGEGEVDDKSLKRDVCSLHVIRLHVSDEKQATVIMLLDQQMQNGFHKHDTHLLKSNDDVFVLDVKQI